MTPHGKPLAALLAAAVLAVLPASAQSAPAETKAAPAVVVGSVDFSVEGRSRPSALRRKIDPYGNLVGTRLADEGALKALLEDKRQVLLNERVIASVWAEYEVVPGPSGDLRAALRFRVVDSWNLIALPYPKYDSNTGLDLSLRGRDYDFAGSMQELDLNLDYKHDTEGRVSYTGLLSFGLPVSAFGVDWDLGVVQKAGYREDGTGSEESLASLALTLKGLPFPVTVAAFQGFSYNPLVQEALLDVDPDRWFLTNAVAAKAAVPLGPDAVAGGMNLGPLRWLPSVSLAANWKPGETLSYYGIEEIPTDEAAVKGQAESMPALDANGSYGRQGAVVALGNELRFGRVDWQGNLRRGLTASLSDTVSRNAYYRDTVNDAKLQVEAFKPFASWIGFSGRVAVLDRASQRLPDDDLQYLGRYLRGVDDKLVSGVGGAFASFALPIRIFDFPTHAIIRATDKLDMEVQAQPFVDCGAVLDGYGADAAGRFMGTAGIEFLAYPKGLRSFIIRGSLGVDVWNASLGGSTAAKPSPRDFEIYIGLGHFF